MSMVPEPEALRMWIRWIMARRLHAYNEQTITDATRSVTQWIIGVRGEVPLVEELATAEDVQSFACGHVRWSDGTPGPAVEPEDIDWTTVDWHFVLKVMHAVL